jgi:general secretion pathway protein A
MNPTMKALYGLKFHPFVSDVPIEALYPTPAIDSFLWRTENGLVHEGGFGLITGDPGTGKSVALRLLADRLGRMRELTAGCLEHPQSNLADFYREMGDLFGVSLRPHNRWAGFRALRERWIAHTDSTLLRPVLLIDEAQEMAPAVLNELRILTAARFDSRSILTVILAGDARLAHMLGREDLLPLGSRIRARLALEPASSEQLRACLQHLLKSAGNPRLMTPELIHTLCDHALGNYRVLVTMASELLSVAARREIDVLDEGLYLEHFTMGGPAGSGKRRAAAAGKGPR